MLMFKSYVVRAGVWFRSRRRLSVITIHFGGSRKVASLDCREKKKKKERRGGKKSSITMSDFS